MRPVILAGLTTLLAVIVAPMLVAAAPETPVAHRVGTIQVGSDPIGVAVNSRTQAVYVTNAVSNTVSVINEVTKAVTATITVGQFPFGVAVDPSTDTIYVANESSGSVSVIDGGTNPSPPR